MNKILSLTRRCVEDYNMIAPGDRLAVGVSGGKDSLMLLIALVQLVVCFFARKSKDEMEEEDGNPGGPAPARA